MKQAVLIGLFTIGAIGVLAAPSKRNKPASARERLGTPYQQVPIDDSLLPYYPIITESENQKELQEAKKRGQRQVATVEVPDSKKEDFKNYRDRFIALKDTPGSSAGADALDQILFELESKDVLNNKETSNDLRFFAAQLIPLRSFRGFFHKIRRFAFKYPMVQSYLVTLAKQFSTNVGIFLTYPQYENTPNSEHMRVFFRYIAEPYTFDMARMPKERSELNYSKIQDVKYRGVSTFSTEADIQNWLEAEVYSRLVIATTTISQIDLTSESIVWDNRIITGSATYAEGIDRFRKLGQAEKHAVLSNLYGNMANIKIFCSYSQTRALELVSELGFLYGIEQFDRFVPGKDFRGDKFVKGASAWERTRQVNSFIEKQISYREGNNGPVIYTLLAKGQENMKAAYLNALFSTEMANRSWAEIKARNVDDETFAFNGGIFRPFIRTGDKSIEQMTSVLRGNLKFTKIEEFVKSNMDAEKIENNFIPIHSLVSGETVYVNAVKFFYSPPKNLRYFMPIFPTRMEEKTLTSSALDEKGNPVQYRDYSFGTANNWNTEYINTYFRVGTKADPIKTGDDVKRLLRVTNQSWGGLMIGMPLTSIML